MVQMRMGHDEILRLWQCDIPNAPSSPILAHCSHQSAQSCETRSLCAPRLVPGEYLATRAPGGHILERWQVSRREGEMTERVLVPVPTIRPNGQPLREPCLKNASEESRVGAPAGLCPGWQSAGQPQRAPQLAGLHQTHPTYFLLGCPCVAGANQNVGRGQRIGSRCFRAMWHVAT